MDLSWIMSLGNLTEDQGHPHLIFLNVASAKGSYVSLPGMHALAKGSYVSLPGMYALATAPLTPSGRQAHVRMGTPSEATAEQKSIQSCDRA